MLVIREAYRVVRDLVTFAITGRRAAVLILVIVIALVVLLSATVTTVGPVVMYPFV